MLTRPKPISLSQCFGFLRAAESVESVSGDAGAVFGPGIVRSKHLFMCSKSSRSKIMSVTRLTVEKRYLRQAATCTIGVPIVGAEYVFTDH